MHVANADRKEVNPGLSNKGRSEIRVGQLCLVLFDSQAVFSSAETADLGLNSETPGMAGLVSGVTEVPTRQLSCWIRLFNEGSRQL